MTKITEAIHYASYLHRKQFRKGDGCPYISHPLIVAEFVRTYKESKNLEELVIAAILHDVLEDTKGKKKDIRKRFGPLVLSLVKELTSNKKLIKKMGKNPYLIMKMKEMSSYALVIKLCDRLSNVIDNPSPSYLEDTAVMMRELEKGREILSNTHRAIMLEISTVLINSIEA